jgi:AcrR family transcriptional regulator
MPTEGTPSLRESYRAQVRERTIEVAYSEAVDKGWDRVRVGQVATRVGVSRALLYKEFGDKHGLGEALVLHESERFLVGVQQVLRQYDGQPADSDGAVVVDAIRASVDYTLTQAAQSPLLRAMLLPGQHPTTGPTPTEVGLGALPVLAAAPQLVELAGDTLVAWLRGRLPQLGVEELVDAMDALIRLTVSHVAQPGPDPDAAARRICAVALRYLRLA